MRIALDARTVYSPTRRGTGKNLIDLYGRVAAMRPEWRFVMFHRGLGGDDPFDALDNVVSRAIDIRGERWNLWQHVRLPLAAWRAGADVLHCPANTAPRWPLVPMIVTIHDLIPLEREPPDAASRAWGRNVARGARKARRVVTPSEYTKGRMVELFAVPADRINVNHWAADSKYTEVTDRSELNRVRAKYGLAPDQGYVFGFSGGDPRKNTDGIVQGYLELPESLRAQYGLVIVGMKEPWLSRWRSRIEATADAGRIFLNGFVPEEDVSPLLSAAALLCYPSFSEGFGLPVLDAFICGTAVLTSNTTSLPEVAGDAAVLVDPASAGDIARATARILTDHAFRADLVAKGRRRLEQFTWNAAAERFIEVVEDVVGERD